MKTVIDLPPHLQQTNNVIQQFLVSKMLKCKKEILYFTRQLSS